MENSDHMNQIG